MKKKNQAIQFSDIHIQNPCHADWEQMTPSERGRLCTHCEKEVYDFTDGDIEKYKRAQADNFGNLCGRFSLKDVPHLAPSQKKRALPIPIFAKSTIYRIAFSFLTITGVQHAFAKDTPEMYVTPINADDLGFMHLIMGNCAGPLPASHPDNNPLHFLRLEFEEASLPKEEETESDTDTPPRAPIVPILNRMPALHKKRLKENEDEEEKRLPWK